MYVAVKGGEKAIDNAHRLLARKRRGDTALPELSVEQIRQQMPLAVSRVMTEGSLYDEQLAALAIKQAAGDLMEAIFLLRAYRTTLPRFAASNRSYVTVAIGCTGGHHRSVYLAERIGAALRDSLKNVQIRHRDLSS